MSNLKAFYIQTDSNNIITDVVQTPTKGYVVHFAELLPVGVHGGWFKLIDDEIVEVPELKPIDRDEEIEALKEKYNLLEMDNADLWYENVIVNTKLSNTEQEVADLWYQLILGGM